MEFQGKYKKGGFDFERNRDRVLKHSEFNVGKRFILKDFIGESRKQRRFYHGAVLALWAYLDGRDYKDDEVIEMYHDIAKLEFNAEIVPTKVKGGMKNIRRGKSTKGKLNEGFLELVIDNLEEQYGVDRTLCLDTKHYDYFKDKIFMNGEFDTYIDYLISLRRVPVIHK